MPRGARLVSSNAIYHVVNRGNQKQHIFKKEADFVKYLQLLKHCKRKFSFKLLGYCLMPNHIHLLLELKKPKDLSKAMQTLTQTYTIWFNKEYGKPGHLWQGRFKSMVIQKDSYFLDCISYVEANPVRANLVATPAEYLWSSYRDRVFGNKGGLLDLPDST